MLQHFAAHGCGVTDVDAHTRFAFVQFASDADANRALAARKTDHVPRGEEALASINDRNATAAAAWDALCAKLAGVSAAAVVPRSHTDRVAVRLARGHETLAVEQVGVERPPAADERPGSVRRGDLGRRRARWRLRALALDGHKPVTDVAAAADEIDELLRDAAGASTRVRVRTSPPALAADITRRLEGATAYALAPGQADLEAHVADVDRAYVCGVVSAPNRAQARGSRSLPGPTSNSRKHWTSQGLKTSEASGHWTSARRPEAGPSACWTAARASSRWTRARWMSVRRSQASDTYKKSQAARADGDLEGEQFDVFVCDMCLARARATPSPL